MALDFPSSPTVGQQYLNWTWNGVAWVVVPGPPLASLAQSSQNSGRNYLDNALFNIQQRGQGPFTADNTYTADRWIMGATGDTVSTQLTVLGDIDRTAIGDEAAKWCLNWTFAGVSTANAQSAIIQRIEDAWRLGGKTVTVSFWAKASSGTPRIGVSSYGYYGTGGSPSPPVTVGFGATPALSTTWTRYSFTGIIPSTIGKTFGTTAGTSSTQIILVGSDPSNLYLTGIGQQSGTVQFWGVQVEVGSQATPLEKLVPEVDLARCQRFYQTGSAILQAGGFSGQAFTYGKTFQVTMRAPPTVFVPNWNSTNLTNGTAAASSANDAYFGGVGSSTAWCSFNAPYTASADL